VFLNIIAAGNLISIYRRFGGICYLNLQGKCDSYTGNRCFRLKFGDYVQECTLSHSGRPQFR